MTALGGDRIVLYPDCDDGSQIYTYVNIHTAEHTHTHTHEINFMLLFVLFVALPCSLRDLSSPTRDGTQVLAGKASCPNHWTTREFPAC